MVYFRFDGLSFGGIKYVKCKPKNQLFVEFVLQLTGFSSFIFILFFFGGGGGIFI